jgi:hypothetical protein
MAVATAVSSEPATVTARIPALSARWPTGTEATTTARLNAPSRTPDCTLDRSSLSDIRGSSGTIALNSARSIATSPHT